MSSVPLPASTPAPAPTMPGPDDLTLDHVRAAAERIAVRWCARRRCIRSPSRGSPGRKSTEVREPPVHRRLQGARRAQRAAADGREASRARRDRRFGGQSQPGPVLSWHPAERARHHRDAAHHPGGEGDADRERGRQGGARRRDVRRGLCHARELEAEAGPHLRPSVRRSRRRRRGRHGRAGDVR